jgi:hypothetical protein
MPSYEIQSALEIRKLFAVKVARAESTRLGLKLFPVKKQKTQKVVFERENPRRGIQAASGLGGPASRVVLPGYSSFATDPGYYKEFIHFTDEDFINRRLAGDWFNPATMEQLEALASDYLYGRYLDRREKNVFDVMQTGGFQALDAFGNIKWQTVYDIQTATSTIPITTYATATPLADFRAFVVQFGLGKSVDFAGGEVWMNANTKNEILKNTNANDLRGVRVENGGTINSYKDPKTGFNRILLANDLPEIVVYDETWLPELVGGVAAAPNRFIADGKALFIGKRVDGVPFGEYALTPATQNGGKAGEWFLVEDKRATTEPYVKVSAGHNGAPVLEYPEAVACATLY